jgi:competence protein ComEC
MDLRITIPAAVAWIAAVLLLGQPDLLVPAAVLGWTLCALVMLAVLAAPVRCPRARAGPRRVSAAVLSTMVQVAVCAATVALVLTVAAVRADDRSPAVLVDVADSGRPVVLTIALSETLGTGPFAAAATQVATGGGGTGDGTDGDRTTVVPLAGVPVLVFDGAPTERTGIGAVIEVTGQLVETDPGDDAAFLVFASGPGTVRAPPPWYLSWAHELREAFSGVAADLPGDGGALLPGLAIGDTSAVSDNLDAAMKTSSLSHLTAVSGANCAIIVGLVLLAAAAAKLGRAWRVVLALLVLVGFVVLVTPEPSVLRAAVMAALVLVAFARGRPSGGLPMLGTAVLLLLVLDPWMARSYGFALSVLATGGLLVLAGPLARLLARWLPLWLATVIAVPLAAQLACQPVLLLLDPSLPVYGIVANLLAAPAAPIATVVGLAASTHAAVAPPVALLLAQAAWLPAAWIGAVARFFSELPLGRVPWIGGLLGAALLAILTVLLLLVALGSLPRRWRRRVLIVCAVTLLGLFAATGGAHIVGLLARPVDWQIAACDIGQGDAMVVRSGGQIALIDTGPDPAPLAECLNTLGIDRVNLLVLTHFDLDHVGGVEAVLGRVDRVLAGPPGESADDDLLHSLAAAGADVGGATRGDRGLFGELVYTVLWPPARLGDFEPGNDASVALQFSPAGRCVGGCLSSAFLGDLGEAAQGRLLATNRTLAPVDVVKVSHHGSADQSAPLYDRLGATLGLIGVGADNDYGHPAPSLLAMLDSDDTAVARTDQDGLVLVAPGEHAEELRMWRENPAANTAKNPGGYEPHSAWYAVIALATFTAERSNIPGDNDR